MSKKSRLIASLCIASLCSQDVCAQTKVMGMEDLFHLADRQSVSIQAARSSLAAASEAVKAAKAERLPDVSVSLSASYLGDGTIWDRHFGNAKNIDMPHFGNNFAIEARQTVYAGGAVSSGVRQAELGRRQAELDLQKNVQEVRFMLAGDYLELYRLDNQAKVLRKNIELAGQVIADMKVRHEQGTALKTDITRYELQKDRLGLSLAKVTDARKNHQPQACHHATPARRHGDNSRHYTATEASSRTERTRLAANGHRKQRGFDAGGDRHTARRAESEAGTLGASAPCVNHRGRPFGRAGDH